MEVIRSASAASAMLIISMRATKSDIELLSNSKRNIKSLSDQGEEFDLPKTEQSLEAERIRQKTEQPENSELRTPEPTKPVTEENASEPTQKPSEKRVDEGGKTKEPELEKKETKSKLPADVAKTRLTETIDALSVVGSDGTILKYGNLAQKYQKYGDEIAAAITSLPEEKYELAIKLIRQSKDPSLTLQINHTIPQAITKKTWFLQESVIGFNMDKYPDNWIPVLNHVGAHRRYNELVLDRMTRIRMKYEKTADELMKTGKLSENARDAIRRDVFEELNNLNSRLTKEDGLLYPTGNYVVLGELKGKIPWK